MSGNEEEICFSPQAPSDSLMWLQDFLGNAMPSGIALKWSPELSQRKKTLILPTHSM